MTLDLSASIRTAIKNNSDISDDLALWNSEPGIHTRVPLPDDAGYPCIVIPSDTTVGDADALNTARPIVVRDIIVYGRNPIDYRLVNEIGYLLRTQFHRNKWAIVPTGYSVIDITANGPIPAPTDDEKTVARLVSLTIRLREN